MSDGACGGRPPGALYRPSPRAYTGTLPVLEYPGHFLVKRVTNAGTIRFKTRLLYLSTALKPHRIGLTEVEDGIWSVYCCDVLLGRIDERKALIRAHNWCYPCSRSTPLPIFPVAHGKWYDDLSYRYAENKSSLDAR